MRVCGVHIDTPVVMKNVFTEEDPQLVWWCNECNNIIEGMTVVVPDIPEDQEDV